MNSSQVIEAFNEYLSKRFRNPFLASFIVAWVGYNRVLVFGLFHFDDEFSLEEKIIWIHKQIHLHQFSITENYAIPGLLMSTIKAVLVGYFIMLVSNVIISASKGSYEWVSNVSNNLLSRISNAKYIPIEDHKILFEKKRIIENQNEALLKKLGDLTNSASTDRETKESLEGKIRELSSKESKARHEIKRHTHTINELKRLSLKSDNSPFFIQHTFRIIEASDNLIDIEAKFLLITSLAKIKELRVLFIGKNRGTLKMQPDLSASPIYNLKGGGYVNFKLNSEGRLKDDESFELTFKYQANDGYYIQATALTLNNEFLKMSIPQKVTKQHWEEDG